MTHRLLSDDDEAERLFNRCLTVSSDEAKARYVEPARVSLLLEADMESARALYQHFLQARVIFLSSALSDLAHSIQFSQLNSLNLTQLNSKRTQLSSAFSPLPMLTLSSGL